MTREIGRGLTVAFLVMALAACGDEGETGPQGEPGEPGEPASCSARDNDDGSHTVACSDGTEITVSDGQDGQAGALLGGVDERADQRRVLDVDAAAVGASGEEEPGHLAGFPLHLPHPGGVALFRCHRRSGPAARRRANTAVRSARLAHQNLYSQLNGTVVFQQRFKIRVTHFLLAGSIWDVERVIQFIRA